MSIKILNMFFTLAGAAIMIFATRRFHSLMALVLNETYATVRLGVRAGRVFAALMYFFIIGFFVGFTDALLRDVEPIYTFVVIVFFFGAVFIACGVEMQIFTLRGLRERKIEILKTFVNAVEMKDPYTKGHSQHVYGVVALLYAALDENDKEAINLSKLLDAALLHDCGKISIKDEILNKRETLSPDDWLSIRTHPENGKKMLDDTYFHEISDWVLYHHERMDGQGYYKLPGQDIPLESRIIAVADTYSALSTDRAYHRRITYEESVKKLCSISGSQLDPKFVEAFLRIKPEELEKLLDQLPISVKYS